ncbi:MAG: glycosyltransferase, partial [Proteobacteria bacterium]|nr:glycosyltransferase [Pseudomonadota bacterium]
MTEAASRKPTLCVGILAMNEGHRIGASLKSAAFADQLLVIDSGSTDKTIEVSKAAGAEVHVYDDWQGFGVQRSRLLEHVKCDYIFFLDADEVISPQLQAQIQAAVSSGEPGIWRVCWRIVAFGYELKAYRAGVGP